MFSSPLFIYLATVLPPIILGVIIWKSDKFPEPGKFLVTAFMLGVSIFLPLDLLIIIAEKHLAPFLGLNLELIEIWRNGGDFPRGEFAFKHFFRAAYLEEGLKFAFLIFVCVRLDALNEPIDAIVYGAAIGLGYAAMENLGYLYIDNAWSIEMVKARYYPLVMHLGFGVVMGWLLSLSLFDETSKFKRTFLLVLSLLIPVIFHGTYNYYGTADIFPILTIILIISIIYWARREQLKKITEGEDKNMPTTSDITYTYGLSLLLVAVVVTSAILYS